MGAALATSSGARAFSTGLLEKTGMFHLNTVENEQNGGMLQSGRSTQGLEPMDLTLKRRDRSLTVADVVSLARAVMLASVLVGLLPTVVHAGKLSWLDDVVQEVIIEAKGGGKRLVWGG